MLKDVLMTENPDSCIIFCRTKEHVNQLTDELDDLGYPCDKIHGGMIQEDRFDVMNEFKRGEYRYLVATDVARAGLILKISPLSSTMICRLKKKAMSTARAERDAQGTKERPFRLSRPSKNGF